MKKKKICFLINSLTSGGAERVAVNIFNKLSENYDIYFYTLENENFYKLNKKIYFKSFSNLNSKSSKILKLFYMPYFIIRYFFEVRKVKPDLLISFLEISNFISSFTGSILNKNVIISIRTNPVIMYPESEIYGKIYNKLLYSSLLRANIVISVSKEIRKVLVRKYDINKDIIKIIYNPHNIKEYIELTKEKIDEKYKEIFNSSFVFINVGRLTEAKGQWFLIRSFKKVVEKHKNTKLIILGEGELREKLENLIGNLGLQNNVFLLGAQNNVFKFLKNSGCFVFSSLWEGLPNTIIEALSINLPIITTDCKTGPKEILAPKLRIGEKIDYPYFGEYGILTKVFPKKYVWGDIKTVPLMKEEQQFADLMIKVIEDKSLRKRYSKGLKRAKDFGTNEIVKEWKKLIEKL